MLFSFQFVGASFITGIKLRGILCRNLQLKRIFAILMKINHATKFVNRKNSLLEIQIFISSKSFAIYKTKSAVIQ